MADFDKDSIMNVLNSILGDDKKDGAPNIADILKQGGSSSKSNSDLVDTAELMSKMTSVVNKLNKTKNNREFALLSAVKPYMREARRGKIDTCLKLLQVVNVVNEMKKES